MEEIFAHFGTVKNVEMNERKQGAGSGKGAYVTYETHEQLQEALKCMDGGEGARGEGSSVRSGTLKHCFSTLEVSYSLTSTVNY